MENTAESPAKTDSGAMTAALKTLMAPLQQWLLPESVTGFYVLKILCVQTTIYGILKYHQKHTALFDGKDRPAGEAIMPHLLGCEGFAVYLYSFILRAACLREAQASASAAY